MIFKRGMVGSPFRKAPRHRHPTPEYLEMEQEVRRAHRRRADMWLMVVIFVAPIVLMFVIELGKSMYFMQDVKTFAATIDQRPPAEVKRDLNRYARHLSDLNPLVRDAAMTALKLGTGWNIGNSPGGWRQMWAEQEPYWQYRSATGQTPRPVAPDWRANLPTSTTAAP